MVARLLFFLAAFAFPLANAFGLAIGATRDEVIAELGQPLAHAGLGSHEILNYPKKVRVILEDGHVASAENLILKAPTPTPEPTVNPVEADAPGATPIPPPAAVAASTPTPAPATLTVETPSPTPESPTMAPTLAPTATLAPTLPPTSAPTAAPAFTLSASHQPTAQPTPKIATAPTPVKKIVTPAALADTFHPVSLFDATELPIAGKIMLLAFHFAATLIAVYFAFRIWNVDALNSGVIFIALIDTALHAIFEALGPMTSGLSTMSAVENGIPAVIMIFTVQHFSFGKKIPESVRVAAAVKALVFVLKLIATAALMDFVFPVH